MVWKIVFASKVWREPLSKQILNHQIKYNFLAIPSANFVWLVKNDFMANFCPWPSKWMGEEWQFNKSKSRGHGRYQSITRQSATIWLHFRALNRSLLRWKLTLFKNVFQVQTLWWCTVWKKWLFFCHLDFTWNQLLLILEA